jgi:hypothetical protein
MEYFGNPAVYWRPNVVGTLFEVAVTGCGLCQALAQLYRAGRKSVGYKIVVFGTQPSAPKLNFLTLSTIWTEKNSGAFILQDSTAQAETAPRFDHEPPQGVLSIGDDTPPQKPDCR